MNRRSSKLLLPREVRQALGAIDEKHRDLLTSIVLAVTLRVAMLCLIPSLVAIGFVAFEARQRSQSNQERIMEANAVRAELVRGFKRADIITCQAVERLKAQNREEALEDFRNLERNLRLLGIEPSNEIRELARDNFADEIRRNERRKCGRLPPPGG